MYYLMCTYKLLSMGIVPSFYTLCSKIEICYVMCYNVLGKGANVGRGWGDLGGIRERQTDRQTHRERERERRCYIHYHIYV